MAILDDGFQHRKVKCDLNIVVINARLFGLKKYFLRESWGALKRADFVVFNKTNLYKVIKNPFVKYLTLWGVPYTNSSVMFDFKKYEGGKLVSINNINEMKIISFSIFFFNIITYPLFD